MLVLTGTDGDPARIDHAKLPVLQGTHAVICPLDEQWKLQLVSEDGLTFTRMARLDIPSPLSAISGHILRCRARQPASSFARRAGGEDS